MIKNPNFSRILLLQICGGCQQSSLEFIGCHWATVWSSGIRSLELLGLRDNYLSGPFPYSSLVYKVTEFIIKSFLTACDPMLDTSKSFLCFNGNFHRFPQLSVKFYKYSFRTFQCFLSASSGGTKNHIILLNSIKFCQFRWIQMNSDPFITLTHQGINFQNSVEFIRIHSEFIQTHPN